MTLHAQQAYAANGFKGALPTIFVSPNKHITSLEALQLHKFSSIDDTNYVSDLDEDEDD